MQLPSRSDLRRALVVLVIVLLPAVGTAPSAARPIDGDDRLLDRFIEDGEVLAQHWLEGRATLQSFGAGDRLTIGPVAAFHLASDFELGFAFDALFVDPDAASSEQGLSDVRAFGKVRLIEKPVILSVGAVVSLPTGDEDKGLGSGEVDMEFFAAIRRSFSWTTLIAHAGMRVNQDSDLDLSDGGFVAPSDSNPGTEGEVSALAGFGFLFPAGEHWTFQTEVSFESARYESLDSDVRLTPGLAYREGRTTFRGGLSLGLSDAAPDWALVGGAVLHF